jgi:hypothetical protein
MNDESLDKMSERDASTLLSQIENSEEELFNLRNKFSKDLKEVLSCKIIKLKKAEEDFNRKLLQQYRSKK